MPSPTRAERRALFTQALQQQWRSPHDSPPPAAAIRAAVDVVLGDPARDATRPTTARHRAQFLALADAIEGGD
jgi:hypothetical protein